MLGAFINFNLVNAELHGTKQMVIQVGYVNGLMQIQVIYQTRHWMPVTKDSRYSAILFRS